MSGADEVLAAMVAEASENCPELSWRTDEERIEAILAAAENLGWRLMPAKPDEAMIQAGAKNLFQPGHSWEKCAADVWAAMSALVPKVPS